MNPLKIFKNKSFFIKPKLENDDYFKIKNIQIDKNQMKSKIIIITISYILISGCSEDIASLSELIQLNGEYLS